MEAWKASHPPEASLSAATGQLSDEHEEANGQDDAYQEHGRKNCELVHRILHFLETDSRRLVHGRGLVSALSVYERQMSVNS